MPEIEIDFIRLRLLLYIPICSDQPWRSNTHSGNLKRIMKTSTLAILLILVLATSVPAQTTPTKLTPEQAREEWAYSTGIQALLWGRPLAENLKTMSAGFKVHATNVNYYRKYSELKTAKDKFVNTPNNVSIDGYCTADLRTEPLVVSVPVVPQNRWTIVQVGDFYDEVVYNIGGSRGAEPGLYLITGPDYRGQIPAGMKEIRLRTQMGVIANRIFVNGQADLPNALAIQQGFHALPLSVFQKNGLRYEIPKTDLTEIIADVAPIGSLQAFEDIGNAMKLFLSANEDHADPLIVVFHQIGLSVANGFSQQELDESTKKGLARAAVTAEQIIENTYAHSAEIVNGWRYTMADGRAGHDLALRAALASNVLGGNFPEEILYPNCRVDESGTPFTGQNKYVLHFDKEKIPPVSVFWNLNMYDEKEFFIENTINRYSIGSTTDGLKKNADGSIDIYIQNVNPGKDKQSNWLPAPAGSFNLTMRLYGAQTPILDGSYRLPAVKRIN